MDRPNYIMFCGVGAALGSVAAISLLAKAEEKPALAPVNASSHWLCGDEEASNSGFAPGPTSVGTATNLGAGMMWGGLLGAHLQRKHRKRHEIVRDGIVMGAIASLLDYGLLPRRLSPGWELALSARAVVLGMAGMTGGAILGGLLARELEDETD